MPTQCPICQVLFQDSQSLQNHQCQYKGNCVYTGGISQSLQNHQCQYKGNCVYTGGITQPYQQSNDAPSMQDISYQLDSIRSLFLTQQIEIISFLTKLLDNTK